jgi:hypothetical protein
MSYLFIKNLFQRDKSLYYFQKKFKIKKNQKHPKKTFLVVFLGGFLVFCFFFGFFGWVFWVGFFGLGGFLLPEPCLQIAQREDRILQPQPMTTRSRPRLQDVALRADRTGQRHHDLLTKRIDRRIRHLSAEGCGSAFI